MTAAVQDDTRQGPERPGGGPRLPSAAGALALLALGALLGVAVIGGWSRGDTTAAPEPARDGMRLVFHDDFSGDALDTTRWTTCYWWDDGGCTNEGTGELQWYQPGNVAVRDGELGLTARAEQVRGTDGEDHPFTSGMVTTGRDRYTTDVEPRFAFTYGVVEVRARVPAGQGLWPALWLLPLSHESRPEIDILEVRGARPDVGTAHIHFDDDGQRRAEGHEWQDSDLSDGWHTFTLDWRPDRITWYVDGVARWSFTDARHIPAEPMYLLMNLAVGGGFVGEPGPASAFPRTFVIDDVRIWQRADG